ncbi:MAG: hypothetical protein KDA44_19325 [Planctomycetales bacterium]|nr:hypothetical protein [Planctomycetales bacterium]
MVASRKAKHIPKSTFERFNRSLDGRVDGADFLAWQRGESPTAGSPADLATWQANFGVGATTPGAAVVPEPGSFALWGLAWAGLLLSGGAGRGWGALAGSQA